jgi:hypothetical protein
MKIISTGQSLKDLKARYGTGADGFYYQNWYDDEAFFTDKPEAGEYEVLIEEKALTSFTYDDQVKKLEKNWATPHPAILMQALLEYHKKTGKYAMKNWYSRTSPLDSGGHRVLVGLCVALGVSVDRHWDDRGSDDVDLSASRKFKKSLDTGSLESFESSPLEFRVAKLEAIVQKLKDALYDND